MSSLRQASAQALQTPAKQARCRAGGAAGAAHRPDPGPDLYALDTAVDVLCIGDLVIALDHA
jgi:hypothetical protein